MTAVSEAIVTLVLVMAIAWLRRSWAVWQAVILATDVAVDDLTACAGLSRANGR